MFTGSSLNKLNWPHTSGYWTSSHPELSEQILPDEGMRASSRVVQVYVSPGRAYEKSRRVGKVSTEDGETSGARFLKMH